VIEPLAERRGRLNSDEPGVLVFNSQLEYVEAMQAKVRSATLGREPLVKTKDLAKTGEMSPTTVGNMASGKTHWPRFSTMFGIASAMGLEVILRGRSRS